MFQLILGEYSDDAHGIYQALGLRQRKISHTALNTEGSEVVMLVC
jgi:hypothetical protein